MKPRKPVSEMIRIKPRTKRILHELKVYEGESYNAVLERLLGDM